jgi:hypothetical protein
VPKQYYGHIRKFSIIKGAQTKLGGMKKNPKDPKVLSIKNIYIYDDAQNHMKKTKAKIKSLSPNTGGTIDQFSKDIQMIKGQETSTSDP